MKHKLSGKIKSAKYYGSVTACSWGSFTMTALICICGMLAGRFDVPDWALYAAVCFSLAMGGYISGYVIGRIKRRNGMLGGLKCGAALFLMITVFGVIYAGSLSLSSVIRDFIFVVIPAVTGGITGANSKVYKAPYS